MEFKGKLTFALKNDMRNLVNFHAGSQKLEIFYSDGFLLSNVCRVAQLKSTVELCVMVPKSNAIFEKKMNCGFKNDMKNLEWSP